MTLRQREEAQVQHHALPTFGEKISMTHAFEAAIHFSWAMYWMGAAIQAAIPNANIRAAVTKAVSNLSRTGRDWQHVCFALAGSLGPTPTTRGQQLEKFRFHLKRGLDDTLPTAIAAIQAAKRLQANNAKYQEAIGIVDALLRTEALPRFQRVFPGFPYLDPTPQGILPDQTIPAVVASHGDYFRTVMHSIDGVNYAFDTIDEGWLPFYAALSPDALIDAHKLMGDVYRGIGYGLAQQYGADMLFIGLKGPADRFCAVLQALKELTHAREGGEAQSVAETLMSVSAASAALVKIVAEEPKLEVRRALATAYERLGTRLPDWWANAVDAGAWGLMRFVNPPQTLRCPGAAG
jgi:hypothetical protein